MTSAKELDRIYSHYDDLLLPGRLEEFEGVLREVDVEKTTVTELLAYLIVSLPWVDRLKGRRPFLCKVKARLKRERPGDVDALLRGL